jgi:benzylsuccinate CoA-transferase BbsE subunit
MAPEGENGAETGANGAETGANGAETGANGAAAARPRPLDGIRVVDLAGPFGAYGARLLADLGATVTRIVPRDGDPLDAEWPIVPTPHAGAQSAYEWFSNVDKDIVPVDLADARDAATLDQLIGQADVLFESWGTDESAWGYRDRSTLAARHPALTVVSVTPFGTDGPRGGDEGTDLIALAAGGLLSLGGYKDTEPIAAHGQARLGSSIFAAAAAIFGLIARQTDGRGRQLDVAAQEVVAAALEDAIPQYDLTGTVRRRAGDTPREAGTGIYRCSDGYVSMVAGRLGTAKAWRSLIAWLVEVGVEGATELQQDEWNTLTHRQKPDSISTFKQTFERFTSTQTKQQLYEEAQRRDIALAPVNEVSEVLHNPQLEARDFFVSLEVDDLGREVRLPGRPYRLNEDVRFQPHLSSVAPAPEDNPQPLQEPQLPLAAISARP